MALGGQVHHVRDVVSLYHLNHGGFVAQVDLLKAILRMTGHIRHVLGRARVGQAIQVHQQLDPRIVDNMPDNIAPDKTTAASDK